MREKASKGIFWLWGDAMYRFRHWVTGLWIVILLSMAFFAVQAPDLFKDNGFTPKGSESDAGMLALEEKLDIPITNYVLVYSSDSLDLTSPEAVTTILDSLAPVQQLPYVTDIAINPSARIAGQEHIQSVNVSLRLSTDEALDKYKEIKAGIAAPQGMKVDITGGAPILHDMQVATKKDIVKAEIIGLPIALLVLLLIFGTVLGALLPLVVGVASVTTTLGITYFIAQNYSLSNFLPNMVTMLGLAVGIDYALFMVSRFREELDRKRDVREAVAMTCQTAGRSIFFSGVAVLIGLLGMLFIELNIFRTLCLGGVLVVSLSVIIANTLLLSLMAIFGQSINRFNVIPARWKKRPASHLWGRIAYWVMKRPVLLVVLMSGILVTFMLPIGDMKLGLPSAGMLPPSYESRHGDDLLTQAYDAREMNPIQIYLETEEEVWTETSIRELSAYADKLAELDGAQEIKSMLTALDGVPLEQVTAMLGREEAREKLQEAKLAKDHSSLMIVIPNQDPEGKETERLVEQIRQLDTGGMQALVTGGPAYRLDMLGRINDRIPVVVGFVMVATYFVLLAAFRSVLLPLKAVLMNVLSLGASIGIVVAVFQKGIMADVLHITSTGYVDATLPIIIFCVVFGISMDYEVFLLSRIAEEYENTGNNEASTAEGLKKTGSLITSAAFILIVVVGSFIFTDIQIIKALGLGLSLAVLLDATLIRVIVVPALMKLLGKANWWAPRWMRRKPRELRRV
ncbi:transporter [Paenibacillus sp. J2TS4]|nr:transporter [Paenibacillus sp. J2TS4]